MQCKYCIHLGDEEKKHKTVCKWGLKLTATGNFSIWLKEKIKAGTKTKHKYFPSLIITSGLLAKPVLQALASSVFSCLGWDWRALYENLELLSCLSLYSLDVVYFMGFCTWYLLYWTWNQPGFANIGVHPPHCFTSLIWRWVPLFW